jgi:hypothetical protein
MAVKTFSVGELATSADVNTYLANAGLVYVTSATASGTAQFLTLQNCFTSTYDNYRITVTNAGSGVNATSIGFQMLNGSTPYTASNYSFGFVGLSTVGASTNTSYNADTKASFVNAYGAVMNSGCSFDCFSPYLTKITQFFGQSVAINSGLNGYDIRNGVMLVETASSYDGIRVTTTGGNFTGTVTIHGYRKV